MSFQHFLHAGFSASVIAASLLLAGCEGQVTADLATEVPADRDIAEVNVTVTGLEFRKDDGTLEALTFRDGEAVDLMRYLNSFDDDPLRLFTDEELPEGNYNGVRVVFATDAVDDTDIVDVDGGNTPLVVTEGNYADFDFSVDDNESSSRSVMLTLDLRQSLSLNDAGDEYTLQPYLRSVTSANEAEVNGTVAVTCPVGDSLDEGGAVYLFEGSDVEPDDRDTAGVEPYATTEIYPTQTAGQFGYTLRHLPEGEYTIAMTCKGDSENPLTDEDLEFRRIANIGLARDETLNYDFTD